MVYVVYCVASGKQEKVQACLVTLWLFIITRDSEVIIGSASGSRGFARFGPGGSTLSRFPCKTPIGKVGTSQYTFVTRKLA